MLSYELDIISTVSKPEELNANIWLSQSGPRMMQILVSSSRKSGVVVYATFVALLAPSCATSENYPRDSGAPCAIFSRDSTHVPHEVQRYLDEYPDQSVRRCRNFRYTYRHYDYDIAELPVRSEKGICVFSARRGVLDSSGFWPEQTRKLRVDQRQPQSSYGFLGTGPCPQPFAQAYVANSGVIEDEFLGLFAFWNEISSSEVTYDYAFQGVGGDCENLRDELFRDDRFRVTLRGMIHATGFQIRQPAWSATHKLFQFGINSGENNSLGGYIVWVGLNDEGAKIFGCSGYIT